MNKTKTRPPCTCGKPSRVLVAKNGESVWLCNDCAEPPAPVPTFCTWCGRTYNDRPLLCECKSNAFLRSI